MATVRDLYQTVVEHTSLKLQETRHICRVMQQAGLLPTGRRGGWKDAPQITLEDWLPATMTDDIPVVLEAA